VLCECSNGNCNAYAKRQTPLPVSNRNLYGIFGCVSDVLTIWI